MNINKYKKTSHFMLYIDQTAEKKLHKQRFYYGDASEKIQYLMVQGINNPKIGL